MALFERCIVPSSVTTPGSTASKFGYIAEATVEFSYFLKHRKGKIPFPASTTDYVDLFGGKTSYVYFLEVNNPRLVLLRPAFGKGLRVPDLQTDDGALKEFYEVKANSTSGISDGRKKISDLNTHFGKYTLAYMPGIAWNPSGAYARFVLFRGVMHGFSVTVVFKFFRKEAGLIVYHICVECDFELEELVVELIVAAVVLMIVFGPEILAAAAAALVVGAEEAAAAAALAAAWAAAMRYIPVFAE